MLERPFGPLWQVKETNDKIRRRLWDLHGPFKATVVELEEALESIMQRLRIQDSRDGQVSPLVALVRPFTNMNQVEWADKGRIGRGFKNFLYHMNRENFKESLTMIFKGISDLEALTRLSVTLEPNRRKQPRGKLFKILRDLLTSMHRALCSSILCSDSHNVSLELATQLMHVGHEDVDVKIRRDAQFKVAISFEVAEGKARKPFWDEVNIKTVTSRVRLYQSQIYQEVNQRA